MSVFDWAITTAHLSFPAIWGERAHLAHRHCDEIKRIKKKEGEKYIPARQDR
jgi:hypothetical protein